jgi:3-oxoacyl-[acyl-carrier protein] reductase
MGNLDGRIAVITGGAQGIGKATAWAFAREGAKGLVLADMNLAKAEETGREIQDATACKCIAVKVNVTSYEEIKAMFDIALQTFGTVDILVNSAGICPLAKIEDIGEKEWDLVLDVNLKGAYLCSREAILIMKEKKFGKIINIASLAGRIGGFKSGIHYSASKGAIITMTMALAKAGAAFNINSNAVAPGYIATDMTLTFGYQPETVPLGRLGTAEDVANVIEFLASEKSNYITGCTLDVNGGLYMT